MDMWKIGLFDVPHGFTASDIEKMVNILNERLVGTPLDAACKKSLLQETKMILEQHIDRAGELFTSLQEAIAIEPEERLYFGGKLNMMKQPEFNDFQKMKSFFDLIEKGTPAITFFENNTIMEFQFDWF